MRTCRRTLCAGLSRSQRLCTRLSSTAAPSIDRRAFGEGMVRNDSTRDAAKLAITSDPNAPHTGGLSLSLRHAAAAVLLRRTESARRSSYRVLERERELYSVFT